MGPPQPELLSKPRARTISERSPGSPTWDPPSPTSPPSPSPLPTKGKSKATAPLRPAIKQSQSVGGASRVSFAPVPERRVERPQEEEDVYKPPEDAIYTSTEINTRRRPVKPRPSPAKRQKHSSSVTSGARQRVALADPNKAICLLTNVPWLLMSQQYCHVLPRSTSDLVLTILEWWWQLKYWTLFIDSHFNIFVLSANWHLAMDADQWTLVPHHAIIAAMRAWVDDVVRHDSNGYNKGKRSEIWKSYNGQIEFRYFFLALTDKMKHAVISRYPTMSDPENLEDFDPLSFESKVHPFSDIGALNSHIHPHFVIFSAGEKITKLIEGAHPFMRQLVLAKLAKTADFGHAETLPAGGVEAANLISLTAILNIYERWTRPIDPNVSDSPRHEWMQHPD
ncbi:hypothetical protein DFH06DRAFT_1174123 [Mycena polygramma]|nr:hypothetical protein DFH06DRAFT_1174123 [Mycena polygramma]